MALVAFPAQRSEPGAVDGNPEHLVCGLAASLSGGGWRPDQFTRFLSWFGGGRDGEPPLDLLADHQRWQVTSHGRESRAVGECLEFASMPPWGEVPGGLLALAELYPGRAPQILADMRRGRWMAMSVLGVEHGSPGRPGDLWPVEVSLVSKIGAQLDPGALVISTGSDAARDWELLTGSPWAGPG